jgi:hypothetical protein
MNDEKKKIRRDHPLARNNFQIHPTVNTLRSHPTPVCDPFCNVGRVRSVGATEINPQDWKRGYSPWQDGC